MNTYIFLQTSRKEPPYLAHTVRAATPEEAIRLNNYFPWDPNDWNEVEEDTGKIISPEERVRQVHAYYGLIKDESAWDYGNGPDGYGTILIEVPEDITKVKTYPPHSI